MNDITLASASGSSFRLPPSSLPAPAPRVSITTRLATMDDLPWIDQLQKKHSKQLGYFPTKQFEGYIGMGGVLVAEAADCGLGIADCGMNSNPQSAIRNPQLGYVISRDRYLKRDELGVVYQLCVRPDVQRGYVGAALLKAVFERAAYGCRLFCCWCAQDLAANRFWEAMGFVPIAFRGGSDKKKRVHIFWQKRIRKGDTTTPWWFPSKTESGALRADRLVLPIPRGMRWDEQMPVVVSEEPVGQVSTCRREKKRQVKTCPTPMKKMPAVFGRPGAVVPVAQPPAAVPSLPAVREKREKPKCDPKLIAAARELRDRWLEQVNADPMLLTSVGKYEVARLVGNQTRLDRADGTKLLPAA